MKLVVNTYLVIYSLQIIQPDIMGKGSGMVSDDHQLRWRNSLRPLDPGILSDQTKKKKERLGRESRDDPCHDNGYNTH